MKNLQIALLTAGVLLTSASFAADNQRPQSGAGGQPPPADEIMAHMDSDQDGKLSQSEIKGPLQRMFTEIDANGDGYLSLEELNNAPKPRGGRPKSSSN